MVAKSFQSLEIVREPYEKNGRMYVTVRTVTGSMRQVRWYTETEYRRMYPNEPVEQKRFTTQKHALGFDNGYITIFKGNTYEENEYFKLSPARYHKIWGWYFVSTEDLPDDIPDDVEPVRLDWTLVGDEDGALKADTIVSAAVEDLIYDADDSEFQGEVGDKLELFVTVERNIQLDGYYGPSNMHIMRDDDGNCYVWTTAAKNWKEGSEHMITGTVKDHKIYRRVRQTVLTRCREVG